MQQQQQQQQQQRLACLLLRVSAVPWRPPRAPTAEELLVAQQARELEEQRARMAAMEAQMSQMQAQMEAQMRAQAEAQRQAEAAAAAKAAAKPEAAAAAAAAKAREDAARLENGAGGKRRRGGRRRGGDGRYHRAEPLRREKEADASTPARFRWAAAQGSATPAQAAPAAERLPPTFDADSHAPPAFRR